MRILRFLGEVIIIISLLGAACSFGNSIGCFFDDFNSNSKLNIDRNPDFFRSQDKTVNLLLAPPRWINKVSPTNYIYGIGARDNYLVINQVVGLICFVLLISAVVMLINLEKKDDGFCTICKVLSWGYIIYWCIPALWLIFQWWNDQKMHINL